MNIWRMMDSVFYGKKTTYKVIYYYLRIVLYLMAIVIFCLFLYFGQQRWIVWRESAAQKSLAQIMTRIQEYEEGIIDNNALRELHGTIAVEQERHRNSYLAPYFANMQAEIFIKEGKLIEASQALEDALVLKVDPITYSMLMTKRALILLDINPEKGIELLKELIENKENIIPDVAQFYLGKYYWVHNDIESAQKVWNEFIVQQSQHRISPSPFKSEVETSLSSLISKS